MLFTASIQELDFLEILFSLVEIAGLADEMQLPGMLCLSYECFVVSDSFKTFMTKGERHLTFSNDLCFLNNAALKEYS